MIMNNFGLSRSRRCDKNNIAIAPDIQVIEKDYFPTVIDGAELIEQVCPVSSLTGNRMSIYDAMQMLGNEKMSRAIEQLLPEIPAIMSDSRLSDDDRVATLASRLDTGSPSEDARLRENLAKIVSDFKDVYDKSIENKKETIKFDESSTSSADE